MTSSLLSPRFSSATRNFRTCFRFLCSLTVICKLAYNCHVYKVFVYFYTEYSII